MTLYEEFLQEKEYLNNLSPRTIKYLSWMGNRWEAIIGQFPTKQNIKEFMIKLCQSNLSPNTVNSYARGFNSYLSWLYENEHTAEHLKIKKIKAGVRRPKLLSEIELRRLISYKPKTFTQTRIHTIVLLMIDTGVRIDEALTLKRGDIDYDNLIISVIGKGNKERVIPISIEFRKILFKYLKSHESGYLFPTREGGKLRHRSSLTQLKYICEPMGIDIHWHKLRHTFATMYLRNGGNIIYLKRVLGHTDIRVTELYIANQTDDLSLTHKKTSLLSKLK